MASSSVNYPQSTGFDNCSPKAAWNRYDQRDRDNTAPPERQPVFVYEEYDEGVTIGYFNGETMCLWNGSDDCSITHWMPIPLPDPPEDQWP
ncbi:DUF551 domain-containing protein [Microtetraspora malaysiensis]|uniref:DUF551 domain-containing protein n=1 Tax=Microtetraspora malaysiensis TaxID=161358 RepID=UPI003D93A2E5